MSPYAVVVGDALNSIEDSYVVIENIQFHAVSPKHAIDAAFKATQAIHACYQEQSVPVWLLFQKVVYGIDTEFDADIPVVEELLSKFE